MNTADQLDLAADLIEKRGWMKGGGWGVEEVWVLPDHTVISTTGATLEVRPTDGPLCLEGGIWAVVQVGVPNGTWGGREPFVACPAYQAVVRYLGEEAEFGDAWRWNDEDGRVQTEVIAALRGAALMVRAEETVEEPVTV